MSGYSRKVKYKKERRYKPEYIRAIEKLSSNDQHCVISLIQEGKHSAMMSIEEAVEVFGEFVEKLTLRVETGPKEKCHDTSRRTLLYQMKEKENVILAILSHFECIVLFTNDWSDKDKKMMLKKQIGLFDRIESIANRLTENHEEQMELLETIRKCVQRGISGRMYSKELDECYAILEKRERRAAARAKKKQKSMITERREFSEYEAVQEQKLYHQRVKTAGTSTFSEQNENEVSEYITSTDKLRFDDRFCAIMIMNTGINAGLMSIREAEEVFQPLVKKLMLRIETGPKQKESNGTRKSCSIQKMEKHEKIHDILEIVRRMIVLKTTFNEKDKESAVYVLESLFSGLESVTDMLSENYEEQMELLEIVRECWCQEMNYRIYFQKDVEGNAKSAEASGVNENESCQEQDDYDNDECLQIEGQVCAVENIQVFEKEQSERVAAESFSNELCSEEKASVIEQDGLIDDTKRNIKDIGVYGMYTEEADKIEEELLWCKEYESDDDDFHISSTVEVGEQGIQQNVTDDKTSHEVMDCSEAKEEFEEEQYYQQCLRKMKLMAEIKVFGICKIREEEESLRQSINSMENTEKEEKQDTVDLNIGNMTVSSSHVPYQSRPTLASQDEKVTVTDENLKPTVKDGITAPNTNEMNLKEAGLKKEGDVACGGFSERKTKRRTREESRPRTDPPYDLAITLEEQLHKRAVVNPKLSYRPTMLQTDSSQSVRRMKEEDRPRKDSPDYYDPGIYIGMVKDTELRPLKDPPTHGYRISESFNRVDSEIRPLKDPPISWNIDVWQSSCRHHQENPPSMAHHLSCAHWIGPHQVTTTHQRCLVSC